MTYIEFKVNSYYNLHRDNDDEYIVHISEDGWTVILERFYNRDRWHKIRPYICKSIDELRYLIRRYNYNVDEANAGDVVLELL